MTRRELLAFSGVGLLLGVLLVVWSTLWPQGDTTGILVLSAGSGLVAAVLVGGVIDVILHLSRGTHDAGAVSQRD